MDIYHGRSFPPPPPPPVPGTDGIKEIYPTAPGFDTWFFDPENPEDGQFDPNGADISKNVDGSWHLDPGTTRMLVSPRAQDSCLTMQEEICQHMIILSLHR